jgi:hypothetical protein
MARSTLGFRRRHQLRQKRSTIVPWGEGPFENRGLVQPSHEVIPEPDV